MIFILIISLGQSLVMPANFPTLEKCQEAGAGWVAASPSMTAPRRTFHCLSFQPVRPTL